MSSPPARRMALVCRVASSLRPGDLVEMEVADFGRLSNPVVAEPRPGARSAHLA